jgi:glycosyltransferase involved in cell wall biosynthesis
MTSMIPSLSQADAVVDARVESASCPAPTRKVLLVVTALDVGGIETYVIRTLRRARTKSLAIDIGYTAAEPGAYAEDARSLGADVIPLGNKWSLLPFVGRLARLLKRNGYHAVCDFTGDFAAASLLAACLAGVKTRVSFYRSSGIAHRRDPFRMAYRTAMRRLVERFATAVLSNSWANFQALLPGTWAGKGKYHVLPNGVDTQHFRPLSPDAILQLQADLQISGNPVVGHVGGLKPEKNHGLMLQVFSRFRHRFPGSHLVFVGEGARREQIENEIGRLGLAGAVTLAGNQVDVRAYLNCMDIFWFPSQFEGMPNALIEAQSVGLPVVAGDVPSIREHVPVSGQALLVRLDDMEGWLRTLELLAGDAEERRRQGQANRQHAVNNYALEPRLDAFLRVLSGAQPASTGPRPQ